MIGTLRRLARLFDPESGRAVILPFDHGMAEGLTPGMENIPAILGKVHEHRVQGVVLNKGLARSLGPAAHPSVRLLVNLSAGTKHGLPSWNKSLVCNATEAHRLGADAVAVHVNIGNDLEDRMLTDLGLATDEAHQLGLPVMAVVYARGGQIVNELDPALVGHCIRLGAEMGADLVCAPYSGDRDSFAAAVACSPAPVLVAGGPVQPDFPSFLRMVGEAVSAGAMGAAIGRNVFQHAEPLAALAELCGLVHSGGAKEA
ncbi:MAG: 2-amino-3,7-dideoxy-D-threo-hept-6-ulosonate synthase [Thermodesulfobacteriota bacterium]